MAATAATRPKAKDRSDAAAGEAPAAHPGMAPGACQAPGKRTSCCTLHHRAVELVGKRWTGAILIVLMEGPLRFSEVRSLVPDISDRLLSERMKELEAEGIVERRVIDGAPPRVEYALTEKGRALEPTFRALRAWAHGWLS